jgi:hypothetical protein
MSQHSTPSYKAHLERRVPTALTYGTTKAPTAVPPECLTRAQMTRTVNIAATPHHALPLAHLYRVGMAARTDARHLPGVDTLNPTTIVVPTSLILLVMLANTPVTLLPTAMCSQLLYLLRSTSATWTPIPKTKWNLAGSNTGMGLWVLMQNLLVAS